MVKDKRKKQKKYLKRNDYEMTIMMIPSHYNHSGIFSPKWETMKNV